MNDRTARFAFVAACIVAPLTVAGSAASLYGIAQDAKLALPLALPVALDLTALAAAAQIRARRHLVLGWVTLVGGVVLSAGLQVADAWAEGPVAWLVHGALPVAALVAFELALPGKDAAPAKASPARKPKPAPRPPAPVVPEVKPTPLRPAQPDGQPVRPAARSRALDELVAEAVALAERQGVTAAELSQRTLRAELGIGDSRARELSRALKDTDGAPSGDVIALNGARS